jgi:hypothetical protein
MDMVLEHNLHWGIELGDPIFSTVAECGYTLRLASTSFSVARLKICTRFSGESPLEIHDAPHLLFLAFFP